MDVENLKEPARLATGTFVASILVGSVPGYFITAILSYFHPKLYEFVSIGSFALLGCQLLSIALLEKRFTHAISHFRCAWVVILNLVFVLSLVIASITIAIQHPQYFQRGILLMEFDRLTIFAGLAIAASGGVAVLLKLNAIHSFLEKIKSTRLFKWAEENLPGLFLSACFFLVYFTFAETINFPGYRTIDLYFDFDISTWLARLSALSAQEIPGIRPVHPAILLFLRPPVWFLSLFLNGDRLHAVFLLHTLTAASSVFMIWLIAKQITGNTAFSLLIASLLGASASHILLGSMVETYIYSAFALILFSFLMHNNRTRFGSTLPVGILITGITISNFAQSCILYLSARPSFKVFVRYILLIFLAVVALNMLENRIFPTARLLFAPSSMDREFGYLHPVNGEAWRTIGRISLTARAIALYGIVAPTPYILDEELGAQGIPHFRTFKITIGQFHVAGYSGLGDVTARYWLILLALGFVLFVLNAKKSPSTAWLPLGLLFCLAFNFVLHTFYGDDPMLYTPDWVYALVLFVTHAFKPWADRRWLHLTLLVFVGLIMVTNLNLIYQIMQISAPLYGQ